VALKYDTAVSYAVSCLGWPVTPPSCCCKVW